MNRKALATAFLAGLLFSVGLGISGMTMPTKVVGFLDMFGSWDPALAGVMGGGILVALLFFRKIIGRGQPFFSTRFDVPTGKDITPSLVIGSAMFGMGWGIAGYCPGPAVTSLVTGSREVMMFTGAMLAGMLLFRLLEPWLRRSENVESGLVEGSADA